MGEPKTSVRIAVAKPPQQAAALRLVLGSMRPVLADVASDPEALGCLITALDPRQQVQAATVAQPLGGRAASVWPVRFVPALSCPETMGGMARALYARLHEALREQDVRVAQAILSPDQIRDGELLQASGYTFAVELQLLRSERADFPEQAPCHPQLTYEPYDNSQFARLCRLVEATYCRTLDCPAMNGMRSAEEAIEGYRRSASWRPRDWFLVTSQGKDVGCLLLEDHPEGDQCELVYMGVHPDYRGRQWGLELTRFAQWQCHNLGRKHFVLAVDSDNTPALSAYIASGFRTIASRHVWLRSLKDAPGEPAWSSKSQP